MPVGFQIAACANRDEYICWPQRWRQRTLLGTIPEIVSNHERSQRTCGAYQDTCQVIEDNGDKSETGTGDIKILS